MDTQAQQLELKRLIIKGKEQGFLTFREINDHLPGDMNDTDQIETVVNMINDMGIEVFDKAPDPDSLLLKTANPDDEEVVEEAVEPAYQEQAYEWQHWVPDCLLYTSDAADE